HPAPGRAGDGRRRKPPYPFVQPKLARSVNGRRTRMRHVRPRPIPADWRTTMHKTLGLIALAAAAALGGAGGGVAQVAAKPTIVLAHGAFADASAWNGVIARLNGDGYQTIAAANPLRTRSGDAATVSAVVKSIPGDVVLVGHSYGGL